MGLIYRQYRDYLFLNGINIPEGLIYLLSGSLIPEYGSFPIKGIRIGGFFKGPSNSIEQILTKLNIDFETRQLPRRRYY